MTSRSYAQEASYSSDNVKAAFLYHFGKFVGWPPETPGDKFTIAVLGATSIAEELARIAPERSVQGKPLAIRQIRSIDEVGDAHMLFVREANAARLTHMLASIQKKPVLVVTDVENGLRRGAVINFTVVEQRVRFEVSLDQADRRGLYLSSRLLDVALRVEQQSAQCRYDELHYVGALPHT